MRKVIVPMFLVFVGSVAAADWIQISGNDIVNIYADPTTVRQSGNLVTMWLLFDYKTAREVAGIKPFLSHKLQYEFDCKNERSRRLFSTAHSGHMGEGVVLSVLETPSNWSPVAPDSIDEVHWKAACRKG